MSESAKKLLQFIDKSPTPFHAVRACTEELEQNGFLCLNEGEEWKLSAGGKYYLTRNQSTVIAFCLPEGVPQGFMITASHTDSPTFKLKGECLCAAFDRYARLNTEPYGGGIYSTWLDRPLSLAGRVILNRNGDFSAVPVCIDRDLLVIPNVAIHFRRDVNSSCCYNPAVDLLPLLGEKGEWDLRALLARECGLCKEEIASYDLYLYNRAKGTFLGAEGEFIGAPRIDNLMCVFGTLQGFLASEASRAVKVFFAADNEETGSETKQGAGSVMLADVLERIALATGTDHRRLLASSMMISADNAHAKHPNHPEFSDGQNAPHLNGGVVIKSNAAQRYTTEALSEAVCEEICRRAGVPVQRFANKSDVPGGSTLGSISNTHVPLLTVDIGMAQLAMHSAFETAGTRDVAYLCTAMKTFYESAMTSPEDGRICLSDNDHPKKESANV